MAEQGVAKRCAIYTRKSTEEGLEKDYNSLDAQRDACAAYILSQSHEGWTQLADHYDDGGISGSSMDRPALKRLLSDVTAGKVDVVVVYKIDRLTRSLADFAKIVDTFDEAGCSFISVTQSFSTTSSMGRLTLNVLLSFAQFEREVTAERIRDKIAASKKRGMWMGGPVPLGYEVQDRKLVVVPEEAKTVRDIMRRYLASDGVPSLAEELERLGMVSKRRRMRDGSFKGGTPIRRGALAHLLSNRIYLGLITHKGEAYEGEHDAIVDKGLFDEVQAKLSRRRGLGSVPARSAHVSVLAGHIRDRHGRPMSPCHTQNHGKRYHYYASIPRDGSNETGVRLPAAKLEEAVVSGIVSFLSEPSNIESWLDKPTDEERLQAMTNARQFARQLQSSAGGELKGMLATLSLQVKVKKGTIIAELDIAYITGVDGDADGTTSLASIEIPTVACWNGHEERLKLAPPAGAASNRSDALIELIARAFDARDKLLAMNDSDVSTMPVRHRRHLERTARLSYLAPKIVLAIINGEQPPNLSARMLVRTASLPLDWAAQRRMLLAS